MEGIEGSPLDSDDIWPVVTMASVNQSSVWEVTSQTDETPCDDTVMAWLHTLECNHLEMAATILFRHLALTILDPDRSRIVSIDFVDNSYHGCPDEDSGELCKTAPTDGTTTCHRYCTAYVVSNGKLSRRLRPSGRLLPGSLVMDLSTLQQRPSWNVL